MRPAARLNAGRIEPPAPHMSCDGESCLIRMLDVRTQAD